MGDTKKVVTILGVAAAVCFSLKYLLPYAAPFVLAALLVYQLNPLLVRIRKKTRWKKEILAAVLLILLSSLLGLSLYFLYGKLMDELCQIASHWEEYYDGVCGFVDDCCCTLEQKTGIRTGEIRAAVTQGMELVQGQVGEKVLPGILDHSVRYLVKLVQLAGFFFILFIAILLLVKDYDEISRRLSAYPLSRSVERILRRICSMGGTYAKAQCVILGIVSALCVAGLYFLKNPYALLAGILIGLLDALPFLGTGTVLLPWALVLLFQKKYGMAAGYLVLFLITNTVRELLEPRLIGERIGIYPFAIAAAVYAGVCFFGIWGVVAGPLALLLTIETEREIFSKKE